MEMSYTPCQKGGELSNVNYPGERGRGVYVQGSVRIRDSLSVTN